MAHPPMLCCINVYSRARPCLCLRSKKNKKKLPLLSPKLHILLILIELKASRIRIKRKKGGTLHGIITPLYKSDCSNYEIQKVVRIPKRK